MLVSSSNRSSLVQFVVALQGPMFLVFLWVSVLSSHDARFFRFVLNIFIVQLLFYLLALIHVTRQ